MEGLGGAMENLGGALRSLHGSGRFTKKVLVALRKVGRRGESHAIGYLGNVERRVSQELMSATQAFLTDNLDGRLACECPHLSI